MDTTEKIYKCGHCGDTNDSLESLKQHMVSVHMPTQPHLAALPQVSAPIHQPQPTAGPSTSTGELLVVEADQSQIVQNTLQIQQDPPKKPPPSQKFKCGHCGVVVNGMSGLKSHLLQDHVKDSETAKELAKADIPQKVQEKIRSSATSQSSVETMPLGQGDGDENMTDQPANKVELNFSVMIPDAELHIFPRHVEPALYFVCKYCEFKGKQYKSVSAHVASCHPKKLTPALRAQRQDYRGGDYGDMDASQDGYGLNRTRLGRVQPYPCNYCNLSFETENDQDIHQRCHVGDTKAMKCCFCQRDAPEHRPWKMLYRHIVTVHPGNMSPKHLCRVCGVACMFPHNLKIHLKTEHGIEEEEDTSDSVTCEHCNKTFKHSSYLKYHLVIRHGIGTEEEKAKIEAQSQRKKEQKIINKRHKPLLTCKLCPYQTNDQYRLRTHTEVVHQGVKRHKCTVCNTAFSDYSTLRRHMWRHRDSKPYGCRYCGFTCIQSTQIKSHYKNKHGLNPAEAKKLIKHVNGPRHTMEGETAADTEELHIQIHKPPQQHAPQTQVIHQQQLQTQQAQQQQQPQPQQTQHAHQAIVHQVHPDQRGVHTVQIQAGPHQPHRTYTVYNDQGMEYTDIQALADAAEGLLAAEQIVIATS